MSSCGTVIDWCNCEQHMTIVCSPLAYMDPLSTNLTHMFCQLFQDALTEYTYAAELAGLGYSIQNTIYGLIVSRLLYLINIVKVAIFIIVIFFYHRRRGFDMLDSINSAYLEFVY